MQRNRVGRKRLSSVARGMTPTVGGDELWVPPYSGVPAASVFPSAGHSSNLRLHDSGGNHGAHKRVACDEVLRIDTGQDAVVYSVGRLTHQRQAAPWSGNYDDDPSVDLQRTRLQ